MKRLLATIFFLTFVRFSYGGVELIHSDFLETSLKNKDELRLKGNVVLGMDHTSVRAQAATWNKDTGKVFLTGNVFVEDTAFTLRSDYLVYDEVADEARFRGDVRIELVDRQTVIRCGYGNYDRGNGQIFLFDKPYLVDEDSTGSRTELFSEQMIYIPDSSLGIARGSVVLIMSGRDSSEYRILCDSLIYHEDTGELLAYGHTRLEADSVAATCGRAIYTKEPERLWLFDAPEVFDSHNRASGDSILASLSNGELESANVFGDVKLLTHPGEDTLGLVPDSRFFSDRAIFYFEDSQLSHGALIGAVKTYYYPMVSDTSSFEFNQAFSDTVLFYSLDGKIDSVAFLLSAFGEYQRIESGESDTIKYEGDSVFYSASSDDIVLLGGAKLFYRKLSLFADIIRFNREKNILFASPFFPVDTASVLPTLIEGTDTVIGENLVYNVKDRRGRLTEVKTHYDKGFYRGKTVSMATQDIYYIRDAIYTTCDSTPPHYWFKSRQTKLVYKDRIVAKPVIMYVRGLPVFYLPYFFFSVRPGRHSGLLPVDIGKFQMGEHFIRNVGYYWAPSDYFDAVAAFDYDENSGILFHGETRYAVRYLLSGRLSGSYKIERRREWESFTQKSRWDISFSHNQSLPFGFDLSGSGAFVSDNSYYSDTRYEAQERMDRRLRSYGALTKSFSGNHFSLSVMRDENLETGDITENIPSVRLSFPRKQLFPSRGKKKWFNEFYWSLSSYYINLSSCGGYHSALDNKLTLQLPVSFDPYITVGPLGNLQFTIFDRDRNGNRYPMRAVYDGSITANTTLYGNFPIGILGIRRFRHIFRPSVSFSIKPEFAGADRFYSFGGITGSYGRTERMSFSISNIFQMDRINRGRMELASLSLSSGYDFLNDRPLSPLSLSLRSSAFGLLDLTLSSQHNFYPDGTCSPVFPPKLENLSLTTGLRYRKEMPISGFDREFSFSVSHYLSQDWVSDVRNIDQWVKFDTRFWLTGKWRISYNIYYDIESNRKVSENLTIYRDMHCWEAIFVWVPTGGREGYYIRINIKVHPEIKLERTKGGIHGVVF